MTFTYTIRDDLSWSDGEPLTADDVAYTLNLYKNNHAYLPQTYLTPDRRGRAHDRRHHDQFDTAEPTGPLHRARCPYLYDYILPKHVCEQVEQGNCPDGTDPARRRAIGNVPSVGSGPFSSRSTRPASSSGWSATRTGRAPSRHIDEIVYRITRTTTRSPRR